MSGKSITSPLEQTENAIKTKVWFKSVLQQSGLENANQLSLATRWGDGRRWSNYASCRNTPRKSSLAKVEKDFPGTRKIFEYGPDNSYLFQVMCCSPNEIFDLTDDQKGNFWWLNTVMPDNGLRQTNDEALWSVILNLQKVLEKDYLMQIDSFNNQHTSPLHFLAACILLFRFAVDRDRKDLDSYVPQIASLLFKCINFLSVSRELERLEINDLIKLWLHQYLWEWVKYSKLGRLFSLVEFPDAETFSNDMDIFTRRIEEGKERCEIGYGLTNKFKSRLKLA